MALLVGMTFATGQLSHGMADTMRIAAFGRQARQQNLRPPALAGNLDRTAELIESLYGAGPAGFRGAPSDELFTGGVSLPPNSFFSSDMRGA